MIEHDIQKSMVSETQTTQKSGAAEREERKAHISNNRNSEAITKRSDQEREAIRGFIAKEQLAIVYQNPFELSSLNGANGFQLNGIAASDLSGYSVSDAGDVNQDGYADVIIGAPGMLSVLEKRLYSARKIINKLFPTHVFYHH